MERKHKPLRLGVFSGVDERGRLTGVQSSESSEWQGFPGHVDRAALAEALNAESSRGTVLVIAALIDDQLAEFIDLLASVYPSERFDDAKREAHNDRYSNPYAFRYRVELFVRLWLRHYRFYAVALRILADLRNDAAHGFRTFDLDNLQASDYDRAPPGSLRGRNRPPVGPESLKIYCNGAWGPIWQVVPKNFDAMREMFVASSMSMIARLEIATHKIKRDAAAKRAESEGPVAEG